MAIWTYSEGSEGGGNLSESVRVRIALEGGHVLLQLI